MNAVSSSMPLKFTEISVCCNAVLFKKHCYSSLHEIEFIVHMFILFNLSFNCYLFVCSKLYK